MTFFLNVFNMFMSNQYSKIKQNLLMSGISRIAQISYIPLILLLTCCAKNWHESPVIYFSNASDKIIKNIRCEWAEQNALKLSVLHPGENRSQPFNVKKMEDFFGLVKLFWTNADGDRIEKEFYLSHNNLPSIKDSEAYNYVQFYFDQDDFEVISSDIPNLSGKNKKMESLLSEYHNGYVGKNPGVKSNALIVINKMDR